MNIFSWDLPPGVSLNDINNAFDDEESYPENCTECGCSLPDDLEIKQGIDNFLYDGRMCSEGYHYVSCPKCGHEIDCI